jgi:hypothetical protein
MLKFLRARIIHTIRWIGRNKIELLDHILLIYVITITVCPGVLPAQRYRIIIGIIYLILTLILVYYRSTGDGNNVLLRFKHKRFTQDTESGLVKFDKNRLNEMIIFVYDLENEMDHLIVVERNKKKK